MEDLNRLNSEMKFKRAVQMVSLNDSSESMTSII